MPCHKVDWDPEGRRHGPTHRLRQFLTILAALYGFIARSTCVKSVSREYIEQMCTEWVGREITQLTRKKDGLVKAVQAFLEKATGRRCDLSVLDALFCVMNGKVKGTTSRYWDCRC